MDQSKDRRRRTRPDDLPRDEVDIAAEKSSVLADEHADDMELEQPYDLGEINHQPERRNQARPEGAGTGETSGGIRRR